MENNQDHSSNEEKVSLEKIINELPKEEKDKFVAAIYAYEKKSWSGPLPVVALFGTFSFVLGMYNHDSVATGLGVATAISLAVIFVLRQVPAWWGDKNMKI